MNEATTASTKEAIDTDDGFDGFYEGEHLCLFRCLLLLTGSREEAEDLAHEAFVRVLERWDRVSRMGQPRGYLYRTALNLHRNSLRRTWRRARRTIVERGVEPDFSPAVIERATLARVLRTVSREQRVAVVLTDLVGLTSEEAGVVLGIDADAVRGRVHRARQKVREELASDG